MSYLEIIIKVHYGDAIPHNTIYRMMLMHQMILENPGKTSEEMGSMFRSLV